MAIMAATITAIGIPQNNLGGNNFWRAVYGLPIIWAAISIVMLLCQHKYESTIFLVSNGDKVNGKKLL